MLWLWIPDSKLSGCYQTLEAQSYILMGPLSRSGKRAILFSCRDEEEGKGGVCGWQAIWGLHVAFLATLAQNKTLRKTSPRFNF